MEKKTYGWLRGLLAAAFGGLSSIVANVTMGSETKLLVLAKVAAVNAVVAVVMYLARSPLPEKED